jgi:hypothetical protein
MLPSAPPALMSPPRSAAWPAAFCDATLALICCWFPTAPRTWPCCWSPAPELLLPLRESAGSLERLEALLGGLLRHLRGEVGLVAEKSPGALHRAELLTGGGHRGLPRGLLVQVRAGLGGETGGESARETTIRAQHALALRDVRVGRLLELREGRIRSPARRHVLELLGDALGLAEDLVRLAVVGPLEPHQRVLRVSTALRTLAQHLDEVLIPLVHPGDLVLELIDVLGLLVAALHAQEVHETHVSAPIAQTVIQH